MKLSQYFRSISPIVYFYIPGDEDEDERSILAPAAVRERSTHQ
jgi:hypothetical protein